MPPRKRPNQRGCSTGSGLQLDDGAGDELRRRWSRRGRDPACLEEEGAWEEGGAAQQGCSEGDFEGRSRGGGAIVAVPLSRTPRARAQPTPPRRSIGSSSSWAMLSLANMEAGTMRDRRGHSWCYRSSSPATSASISLPVSEDATASLTRRRSDSNRFPEGSSTRAARASACSARCERRA